MPRYPEQYAMNISHTKQYWLAENLGIRKPTVNENLTAAVTNTYQVNDILKARRVKNQLECNYAHERSKGKNKKA